MEGRDITQWVNCLLSIHRLWVQFPAPQKPDMIVHNSSPSTQEVKTRESEAQGHIKFKDSMRPCLKNEKKNLKWD